MGEPEGCVDDSSIWLVARRAALTVTEHLENAALLKLLFSFFEKKNSLVYSVLLVSGVQQSDSVIQTHIFTLFQILVSYRVRETVSCLPAGRKYLFELLSFLEGC